MQAALRHGDDITGATTFLLEEGLDTGPVFGVVTEAVRADDTAGALLRRLANSGATLLSATLDGIADGSLSPRPQPADRRLARPEGDGGRRPRRLGRATHADRPARPLGDPRSGCVDDVPRRAPRAWARSGRAADAPELKPGELHAEKRRVLVGTGGAPLELGEVRPVGKRAMPAADWARGVRIEPRRAAAMTPRERRGRTGRSARQRATAGAHAAPPARRRSTRPGSRRWSC